MRVNVLDDGDNKNGRRVVLYIRTSIWSLGISSPGYNIQRSPPATCTAPKGHQYSPLQGPITRSVTGVPPANPPRKLQLPLQGTSEPSEVNQLSYLLASFVNSNCHYREFRVVGNQKYLNRRDKGIEVAGSQQYLLACLPVSKSLIAVTG